MILIKLSRNELVYKREKLIKFPGKIFARKTPVFFYDTPREANSFRLSMTPWLKSNEKSLIIADATTIERDKRFGFSKTNYNKLISLI